VFFPMTFRVSSQLVGDYFRLFVNRRAYTVQSARPHPESDRHYYYRPTDKNSGAGLSLTTETLRRHLESEITIALYAINPTTQGCKWIAIDADYKNALEEPNLRQTETRSSTCHSTRDNY
jgi:hypothetical protein